MDKNGKEKVSTELLRKTTYFFSLVVFDHSQYPEIIRLRNPGHNNICFGVFICGQSNI